MRPVSLLALLLALAPLAGRSQELDIEPLPVGEIVTPTRRPVAPARPAQEAAPAKQAEPAASAKKADAAPSLDFDLLGDEPVLPPSAVAAATVDPALLARRRTMLTVHQTLGLGLCALMAGSMVTGQLNYDDRFIGGSNGRYELSHKVFVYSTLTTFSLTGLLAIFAPEGDRTSDGIDRVMIHRIGLAGATVGMISQAVIGLLTTSREGYANQGTFAVAHLVSGYATLGFMMLGVGAIVF